ncbi:DUF5722 domain-containing protein [Lachnospiraceae bacterium 45-W7]
MGKYVMMLFLTVALAFGAEEGIEEKQETEEIAFYTITFEMNGGQTKDGEEMVCLHVAAGELPGKAADIIPIRTGYVFMEWQTPQGELWDYNQPIQGDITLTAVWQAISYQVQFDGNGGSGEMQNQDFVYGQSKKLSKNKYTRQGYYFAGWNTCKDSSGTVYKNNQKVMSLAAEEGDIVVLYAMWTGVPYKVRYDGNGADSGEMADSSHVYGIKQKLENCQFKKKGYTFTGWSTRQDGTGTKYQNQQEVKNLTSSKNKIIILYARWKEVKYTITYHTRGGRFTKESKKSYTVNTKTFTLPTPFRRGYDFDGWYSDREFRKRAGQIRKGNAGNKKFYAKWVKCTRQAKEGAATITRCRASGKGKVSVKASIKKRIASSDDYYYLVYVNPANKKPYKKAAKAYKKKEIHFTLKTSQNQGFVISMFAVATKKNGRYQLLSKPSYVKNPEKAAENKMKYKPGKTKKGIQFDSGIEEVYDCDAKQYFLNFTASLLFDYATVPYKYNGKTYYFNSLDYYREVVKSCNKNNVNVTVQMMLDWKEGHTDLIDNRARVPGAAPYYSWNIRSNSSREKMEAMFCYLGMVFGKKDCYVSNWILGNEVNHPSSWNYAGSMSDKAYFEAYAYAFRALYYGVRSQYSEAHIFICTDNYWNTSSSRRYSAKEVIDLFPQYLNKVQKGLKWNLAYHAYSYPIGFTRFWKGYGITKDINTPSVTMKNLSVLTNYMKKKFGSSMRIILSEQGYSSVGGESDQAAALAYSYYIAACNPMVDAFIIRSYRDNPTEAAQGLRMGIVGKEAFLVFKYMDTASSAQYTAPYLGIIGASSWEQIVPGYREQRIRKMYRRY